VIEKECNVLMDGDEHCDAEQCEHGPFLEFHCSPNSYQKGILS
jgi:hypothetical protein